jgi:hypothetical protein
MLPSWAMSWAVAGRSILVSRPGSRGSKYGRIPCLRWGSLDPELRHSAVPSWLLDRSLGSVYLPMRDLPCGCS